MAIATGDIVTNRKTLVAETITINSRPDNAGQAPAKIANTDNSPAALINVKFTAGAAPTAGAIVAFYLVRENANGESDDGWDGTNSAFTPKNSPLLGTLVSDGGAGEVMEATFDTAPLGPLGPNYGVAYFNTSGDALAAAGNLIEVVPYFPHVQQ